MAARDYSAGPLTIHWDSSLCYHAAECIGALPNVFDPKQRPWIQPEHASTEELTAAIDRCPSGALSYTRNDEQAEPDQAAVQVSVRPNGPLKLTGTVEIVDDQGAVVKRGERLALCRCGSSDNKPFCDGAHSRVGFADPGLTDNHPSTTE